MSNPRDIRQIGYFRPDDASAWQAVWHGDYVFVADNNRGIDILRFSGGTASSTVTIPAPFSFVPAPAMDLRWGYMCPVGERLPR